MTPSSHTRPGDGRAAASTLEDRDRVDTSRFSFYVNDGFYNRLREDRIRWQDEWRPVDRDTRDEVERLLVREAQVLDDGQLEDWLAIYTRECLYWIPITPGGGDPRREASLAFDDRRRLEDRIYWLRTGLVWGQIPPSRTSRMISNLDVSEGETVDAFWVRSNFCIAEFRAGAQRTFYGRYRHTLRREDGELKIAIKRIELIDSEHGHENLTIVF